MTGIPVGRPTAAQQQEFDVFTPIRRTDQDGPAGTDAAQPLPYPESGSEATDAYVSPYSPPGASPYQEDSAPYQDNGASAANGANGAYGDTGTSGTYGNEAAFGNNENSEASNQNGEPADDFKGLPRRVRQANLAPQLRASAAAAGSQGPPSAVPPATAASLSDMRNTLSAMQRGWQQGRSQTQRDAED